MTVHVTPLADYLTVRLEPVPPPSTLIHTPEPAHTPAQWATIAAVGPRVRELHAGQSVLVSTHQGVAVSDHLLIPYAAVLLTRP